MSAVNNLLAAIKPNPANIAADRQIDKKTRQTERKSQTDIESRIEASPTRQTSNTTTRKTIIDAETLTVISQTIDESTNSVVSQYPNEVQLRLRAYLSAAIAPTAQSVSFSRSA